jgi:intracellular sulfur oxidation DsrE/DsrF family protein
MSGSRHTTPRRGFLSHLGMLAAGVGLTPLLPGRVGAATAAGFGSASADPALDRWFARIDGKHRQVFDAPEPNGGLPGIFPRVYAMTMGATYPGETITAVLILRHGGVPLALQDSMWSKYKIGEMINVKDGDAPATRNVFATITGLPLPGLGVAELLKSGMLVGACDVALTMNSAAAAKKMDLDPAEVKKDWVANLLPGVQVVPSGVMAVGRAQELGCAYCFAG